MASLSYTTTIPSFIADGEYLIRHELLALHQANTPQFYPECAQLIVTGGGGKTPPSRFTAKFPGSYGASDPGVRVDIYSQAAQTITTYSVPGPGGSLLRIRLPGIMLMNIDLLSCLEWRDLLSASFTGGLSSRLIMYTIHVKSEMKIRIYDYDFCS